MTNSRLYDLLKWVALIVLPTLGMMYYLLAGVWGLPDAEDVLGSMMAVELSLGILIVSSHASYTKQIGVGDLVVQKDRHGQPQNFRLVLDQTPEELSTKHEVRFVVREEGPETLRSVS